MTESTNKRVGIGFQTVTHPHVYTRADILSQMPGVELVSVFDGEDRENATVFRDRYDVEMMESLDDFLADDRIDAVIVSAWTHNMADQAIRALEAGKHVLLEKPGSNSPEAMQRVCDAVERTGGYLTLGYMVRQSQSHERLKEVIASGVLGRITATRFHVSVPAPDAVTPWFNLEDDLGGVLFEDGCHMVDLIVDLFGKPRSVKAVIAKYDDLTAQHGHRYEDTAACLLEWDDQVGALDVVGWEANDWLETWEVALFGENGTAIAGPLPDRLGVYLREPAAGMPRGWTRWNATSFNDSWLDHDAQHVWHAVKNRQFFRAEVERFVNDVRSGGDPQIPASHGLAVIETIAALYQAGDIAGVTV